MTAATPPPISLSAELFQQIVEAAPTAKLLVNDSGQILLVNAHLEKLFGYSRSELLGQMVEILIPERFRQIHPAVRSGFSAQPQSRAMGVGRDLYGRRRDGSEFPIEIGLNPIQSESGKLVLAVIVDITRHKQQEERFRRVVEYTPSAMVMIDARGRIVLANAQAAQLLGYPDATLLGQMVEDIVPERYRAHHPAFRTSFVTSPHPRPMGGGRDLFARRRDGSEFPVEIGLNPIETDEGPMVLAAIVDITERQRTQARLEGALKEKTVLLNEVHHRVKNNLQVISSLLNLQARHLDDENVKAVLTESQNRVKAMALTHQLLYERKDFSSVELVEYLQRLTQLLAGSYRTPLQVITLDLQCAGQSLLLDLERAIPCGLIVNELVSNAFKHAFPDNRNGCIGIALKNENGIVVITVEDDGIGLPADFELSNVRSLGLQLVPLLMEQIHGQLTVQRDTRTRFQIRFPHRLETEDSP